MEPTNASSVLPNHQPNPRRLAPQRTRVPGSRNLNKDEKVLIHHHLIQRTKQNKATKFFIHGVDHTEENVCRKIGTSFDGINDQSTPKSKELDFSIAGNTYLGKLPIMEFFYYSESHRPVGQWRDNNLIRAFRLFIGCGEHVEAKQDDNLEDLVNRLADQGNRKSPLDMVRLLIHKGQVSTSRFLGAIFRSSSESKVEILRWLDEEMDVADTALGVAAFHNDFEAVDALLNWGANVNGNISHPHSSASCPCKISVIAYAKLPSGFEGEEGASDEMIAFLLHRGVVMWTGVNTCLLGALRCALRRSSHGGLFDDEVSLALVRSIVEQIQGFSDVVYEAESILEAFILDTPFRIPAYTGRYQVLEYLLDQGATPSLGSPLALLIYAGGPHELVQKLLGKTDNINAYCSSAKLNEYNSRYFKPWHYKTIRSLNPLQAAALKGDKATIQSLLDNGADTNSPARDIGGVTPLQAICCTRGDFSFNQETRMEIVKLFVDHPSGPNVNAAPAWAFGLSALQAAAVVGDIQVAEFLLSRRADINAPACKYGGGTALALATREGHIEMVQFLLENGATIPPDGKTISSFGITHDDNRSIQKLLDISAQDLKDKFGGNAIPARDCHDYEAEWAHDPTYKDKS